MSQQWAQAAKRADCLVVYTEHSRASGQKRWFSIMYRLGVSHWMLCAVLCFKKDVKVFKGALWGQSCERAGKCVLWGHLVCPVWRKLREDLTLSAALWGEEAEGSAGLCSYELMAVWEWHRTVSGEVQTGHWEECFYYVGNPETGFLEGCLVTHGCQHSRGHLGNALSYML